MLFNKASSKFFEGDFHGKNRPKITIGSGYNNNLFIPYSVYKNIVEYLNFKQDYWNSKENNRAI